MAGECLAQDGKALQSEGTILKVWVGVVEGASMVDGGCGIELWRGNSSGHKTRQRQGLAECAHNAWVMYKTNRRGVVRR